jgi:hypothetical protein
MATNPHILLDRLEDPFAMFPVQHVSDTLFAEVEKIESQGAERRGWWSPSSRKYWTVQDEHEHETIGLLIGAVFVLGQATITQTVSILEQLRELPPSQNIIPKDKNGRIQKHAAIEATTNESKLVVINAVSNYFKHCYEWPESWVVGESKGVQAETMRIALKLGMSPAAEITDNLRQAARCLGLDQDAQAITIIVQDWREAWARELLLAFGLPDRSRSML